MATLEGDVRGLKVEVGPRSYAKAKVDKKLTDELAHVGHRFNDMHTKAQIDCKFTKISDRVKTCKLLRV